MCPDLVQRVQHKIKSYYWANNNSTEVTWSHSCYTTHTCDFSTSATWKSVALSQYFDNSMFSRNSKPPPLTHTHCPSFFLLSTRGLGVLHSNPQRNRIRREGEKSLFNNFQRLMSPAGFDEPPPPISHIYHRAKPKPRQRRDPKIKTWIDAKLSKGWQRITMLSDTGKRICQML